MERREPAGSQEAQALAGSRMSRAGVHLGGGGTLYMRELGGHRQPGLGISEGMVFGRLPELEVQSRRERRERRGAVDQRLSQ